MPIFFHYKILLLHNQEHNLQEFGGSFHMEAISLHHLHLLLTLLICKRQTYRTYQQRTLCYILFMSTTQDLPAKLREVIVCGICCFEVIVYCSSVFALPLSGVSVGTSCSLLFCGRRQDSGSSLLHGSKASYLSCDGSVGMVSNM